MFFGKSCHELLFKNKDVWNNEEDENFNSFAGEPVSASFYYVPTKNYDSGEEPPLPPPRRNKPPEDVPRDSIYGRKFSRSLMPEYQEALMYGEKPMRGRRRSMYTEEPIYMSHPMQVEPIYGAVMPPAGYISPMAPPRSRSRMSLNHQPDYVMANYAYGTHRRPSRLMAAYESLSPEYEDWARPFPKTAPENFHLSRYGHLQIDYSFSWNSLDRLIRYQ
ncbi:uncharacterized protein LOC115454526 isoform X2 [Manduca sexta]|uniref:uncharacterized protein LOC115454526 isoform X2 n=1 Tax=Manduca sexta TaxID=7130 RepID=UPI0011825264|nr:uncharacterized protein LOC115454526 isoform X2 [Manduca sexta]